MCVGVFASEMGGALNAGACSRECVTCMRDTMCVYACVCASNDLSRRFCSGGGGVMNARHRALVAAEWRWGVVGGGYTHCWAEHLSAGEGMRLAACMCVCE